MDFTLRENYKLMSNLEKSVAINLENTAHYEKYFKSRYNF